MSSTQALEKGQAVSARYARTMHAWAVVLFESRPYLAVYIYRGRSTVDLALVHDYRASTFIDEAMMVADYLNERRGIAASGVKAFVDLYQPSLVLSRIGVALTVHIHPPQTNSGLVPSG